MSDQVAGSLLATYGVICFAAVLSGLAVILLHDFAQRLADDRVADRDERRRVDSFADEFIPHAGEVAGQEASLTSLEEVRAARRRGELG